MLTTADLALWGMLLLAVSIFLFIVVRRPQPMRAISLGVGGAYAVAVISLTFGDLPVDPVLIDELRLEAGLVNNWIPFRSISHLLSMPPGVAAMQVGGNLALLAPMGFLLPALWARMREFGNVLVVGVVVAVTIELLQWSSSVVLGFTYKVLDVDDLILNVLGVVVGWIAWKIFIRVLGDSSADIFLSHRAAGSIS